MVDVFYSCNKMLNILCLNLVFTLKTKNDWIGFVFTAFSSLVQSKNNSTEKEFMTFL